MTISTRTSGVLVLHQADDVGVAVAGMAAGSDFDGPEGGVRITGAVPPGHKVALRAIAAGAPVRKYGQVIGFASAPISPGEHVHVHNLVFGEFAPAAGPAEPGRRPS